MKRLIAVMLLSISPAAADGEFDHVLPQLSFTDPCGPSDGCLNTWSLASRLGQALSAAETLYGPRDKDWTILGVEFTSRNQPSIWYPNFPGDGKTIIVQLTQSAATNEAQALFQLGHEVIHLLSPTGGPDASILEEGLAMVHAIDYARAAGADVDREYIGNPRYTEAFDAVSALRESHGQLGFQAGIRVLREQRGGLSGLNEADIAAAFPRATPVERTFLLEAFNR